MNVISKTRKTWVTSDLHFGHKKIMEYEPIRQQLGTTIDEVDEGLIETWNSMIAPEDHVLVLGDVCMQKKHLHKCARLNGKKILIVGNHDLLNWKDYIEIGGFVDVRGSYAFERVIFSHYPIHNNEFRFRVRANVHGHTHSMHLDEPHYYNVCLDANDLKPILLNDLMEQINKDYPNNE